MTTTTICDEKLPSRMDKIYNVTSFQYLSDVIVPEHHNSSIVGFNKYKSPRLKHNTITLYRLSFFITLLREADMSFWQNFGHWLLWTLLFWQCSAQPLAKISSIWQRLCHDFPLRYHYMMCFPASLMLRHPRPNFIMSPNPGVASVSSVDSM